MGLEGRPLRQDGTNHKTFNVFRLHRRGGVEARLPRFPDQVAIARLSHPELRDPGPDQRDLPHARLRMSTLVSSVWSGLKSPESPAKRETSLPSTVRQPVTSTSPTLKSSQWRPRDCIVPPSAGSVVSSRQAKAPPRSQSRSRPMITRRISEVPPPGRRNRASRK